MLSPALQHIVNVARFEIRRAAKAAVAVGLTLGLAALGVTDASTVESLVAAALVGSGVYGVRNRG